jgi:hypothetical protein
LPANPHLTSADAKAEEVIAIEENERVGAALSGQLRTKSQAGFFSRSPS